MANNLSGPPYPLLPQVGDPQQLPPPVNMHARNAPPSSNPSSAPPSLGAHLVRPLFQRLSSPSMHPIMLRTQYRCHPTLSKLASDLFYQGQVLARLLLLSPCLPCFFLRSFPRRFSSKARSFQAHPGRSLAQALRFSPSSLTLSSFSSLSSFATASTGKIGAPWSVACLLWSGLTCPTARSSR